MFEEFRELFDRSRHHAHRHDESRELIEELVGIIQDLVATIVLQNDEIAKLLAQIGQESHHLVIVPGTPEHKG